MKFIYKILALASLLLVGKFAMAQIGVVFDGSQDQILIPNQPHLEFTSGTIECWIKPNFSSNNQGFIAMRSNGADSRFSFHINVNSNTIGLYNTLFYRTVVPTGGITAGTWYHVAFIMSTTQTEVIWNGTSVGFMNTGINTTKTGKTLAIGSPNDTGFPTEYFNGSIDDVRIWSGARTITEINDNMNNCLTGSEANLLAFYNLDENAGTTANDLTSNANDGTLQFDATWAAGVMCIMPTSDLKIVNNNNAYIRLNGGANFIVNDSLPGVFVAAGVGNGYLSSEGESNVVKWNIGDKMGNYDVPFNTKWSTNIFIPVSVNVTTAGSVDGNIIFSTYETTTDLNIPWASDVTNMNSGILGGADGSLFAIDRFWRIDANNYTSKPNATISLGYDDAANEMGGTNTITEANLRAQYFNAASDNWEGLEGIINTTTNVVSSIPVTTANFHKTWILVDNTTPLPIHLDYFNVLCENNKNTLYWESNSDYANVEIQNSVDGKEWNVLANLTDNESSWETDNSNIGIYFRLKFKTQNNEEYISEIIASDCNLNKFDVILYPNPTTDVINFQLSDKYKDSKLTIYNSIGEHVANYDLNTITNINMIDYSKGTYHFFFYHTDGSTISKSVIKL